MIPEDLRIAEELRANPLMLRPSATQPLGSRYSVTIYVKAAYTGSRHLSGRDIESLAAALSDLREPEAITARHVTAAA